MRSLSAADCCFSALGSLRSYYGDAEENVDKKMNLYFTYESQDTLGVISFVYPCQCYHETESGTLQ